MIKDTFSPLLALFEFFFVAVVLLFCVVFFLIKSLTIPENWNHVSGHITSHNLHDTAKDLSLHLEQKCEVSTVYKQQRKLTVILFTYVPQTNSYIFLSFKKKTLHCYL